jgi:hypothetical protein
MLTQHGLNKLAPSAEEICFAYALNPSYDSIKVGHVTVWHNIYQWYNTSPVPTHVQQ